MLDFGNDLKGAATDSMKKCASMLGIASDVYGKAEFKEETGNDILPPKPAGAVVVPVEIKDELLCANCDGIVSQAGADFSKRLYGKQLCRECVAELKPKQLKK